MYQGTTSVVPKNQQNNPALATDSSSRQIDAKKLADLPRRYTLTKNPLSR
jgi:hypothetical protein